MILVNKDKIYKVKDLNFDEELQVKKLKIECIILRNRHLRRLDRDGEEEIIDKIDKLIRKKVN